VRVLYRSSLNPFTGYGTDGIGMAQGLVENGVDVMLQPFTLTAPIPQVVANLLTKTVEPPFDLYLIHHDPPHLEVTNVGADIKVGWTMWEYTTMDLVREEQVDEMCRHLESLDALVSYEDLCYNAMELFMDENGINKPKHVICQGGYRSEDWPEPSPAEDMRKWGPDDPFRFCMVGQLGPRKNPFVAINAFCNLHKKYPKEFAGAELHLKTNHAGLHPNLESWAPGLFVHYAFWPPDLLRKFYYSMNVLLAPSWGEGKNMPALEMLSTGGTVIATNWAGHKSWMDTAYAYPLNDFELVPTQDLKTLQWFERCLHADQSQQELEEVMMYTFRNREEAREKGQQASAILPMSQSWDHQVRLMLEKVTAALPEKGRRAQLLLELAGRG